MSANFPRRTSLAVAALVLAGLVAPLAIYGLWFGSVPTVTPDQAKAMLRESGGSAVLVDVRGKDAFAAGHIEGAVNWPVDSALAAQAAADVPPALQGKTLLLVCDVGVTSIRAAGYLVRQGIAEAVNVRGGIQEWIRSASLQPDATFDRWRVGTDPVGDLPSRRSPPVEQILAVFAFFLVKPIYTLLSLLVAIALWRSTSPDLVALRWAMISFFLGENACAVNYFAFRETSYLAEYLHCYGMLACFGFTAYAILEGLDRRVLRLSDPQRPCAAVGLCGRCIKSSDVPCGMRQLFYVLLPALIVVAMMLPTADWQDTAYNTWVMGQPYNYAHLRIYQFFENWYCAAAAVLMFAVSLAFLALKRGGELGPAKIAMAAGLGALGFGMLRMVLGGAYDQNRVWYLVWEESTEFLFLLGVCFTLWNLRHGLFAGWKMPE